MMTFTNLEKYVCSKKCLKQRRQPAPLPPTKSKAFSRRKSHLATAVICMQLNLRIQQIE